MNKPKIVKNTMLSCISSPVLLYVNIILFSITSILGYNYYKLYNIHTKTLHVRSPANYTSGVLVVNHVQSQVSENSVSKQIEKKPLKSDFFSIDVSDDDEINQISEQITENNTELTNEEIRVKTFQTTEKTKKAIILIAFHRSGSSFTGELLNIHPDVFYSYEPLKLVHDGCGYLYKQERLKLMRDMINCEIPDLKSDPAKYLQNPEFKTNLSPSNIFNETVSSNYMFRTKSKRLCSGEFCENIDYSTDGTKCRYNCASVDAELAKKVCLSKTVGIKVIRLCEMELIEELMLSMPNVDFKIVLLNRDPRGIVSSRKKVFNGKLTESQLVTNVKWTCNYMLNRYNMVLNKHPWLKPYIRIARYETISKHPIYASRDFYNFVNLPILKETEDNIKTLSGYHQGMDKSLAYATTKNSKRIWQNWRTDSSFELVSQVQGVCKDTMAQLGYKLLENEADLRDFDVELVGKIELREICTDC